MPRLNIYIPTSDVAAFEIASKRIWVAHRSLSEVVLTALKSGPYWPKKSATPRKKQERPQ